MKTIQIAVAVGLIAIGLFAWAKAWSECRGVQGGVIVQGAFGEPQCVAKAGW